MFNKKLGLVHIYIFGFGAYMRPGLSPESHNLVNSDKSRSHLVIITTILPPPEKNNFARNLNLVFPHKVLMDQMWFETCGKVKSWSKLGISQD